MPNAQGPNSLLIFVASVGIPTRGQGLKHVGNIHWNHISFSFH
jgi:hypothetical protein